MFEEALSRPEDSVTLGDGLLGPTQIAHQRVGTLGPSLIAQGHKLIAVAFQIEPLTDGATLQGPFYQGTIGLATLTNISSVRPFWQTDD